MTGTSRYTALSFIPIICAITALTWETNALAQEPDEAAQLAAVAAYVEGLRRAGYKTGAITVGVGQADEQNERPSVGVDFRA